MPGVQSDWTMLEQKAQIEVGATSEEKYILEARAGSHNVGTINARDGVKMYAPFLGIPPEKANDPMRQRKPVLSQVPREAIKFEQQFPYGRVGFVLLGADGRIEQDMMQTLPKIGLAAHFTRNPRLAGQGSVTPEALADNERHLANSASTFGLPEYKVICFGCTSASFVIGLDKVEAELVGGLKKRGLVTKEGDTEAVLPKTTSLSRCVLDGFRAIFTRIGNNDRLKRAVVFTPYIDSVNEVLVQTFHQHIPGLDILEVQGLNLEDDADILRVTADVVKTCSKKLFLKHCSGSDRPDIVFISCGSLPAMDILADLEDEIGVPVVCSNSAMAWATARMAGYKGGMPNIGILGQLEMEEEAVAPELACKSHGVPAVDEEAVAPEQYVYSDVNCKFHGVPAVDEEAVILDLDPYPNCHEPM